MVEADIRPEHIVGDTAAEEHTEIADTVVVADTVEPVDIACNLVVHSALPLPLTGCHTHHRSAHQDHFVSHNLHTIKMQELR